MSAHSPLVNVMTGAAEKAARPLIRDFNEIMALQSSTKPLDHFFKVAQDKATQTIIEFLSQARPDFGIKSYNEMLKEPDFPSKSYWFITSVCGIKNYMHAFPTWAIQISCIENDQAIACVVFNPILNESFIANKGSGAYLNSHRLRTSKRKTLDHHVLIGDLPVSDPTKTEFKKHNSEIAKLTQKAIIARTIGCPALTYCYVAAGRMDAAFGYIANKEVGLNAELFMTESGGFHHNDLTAPLKRILIGNDQILTPLKNHLAS